LVYKGLLNQRPQDELALGVARIHINDDWNDVQTKVCWYQSRGKSGSQNLSNRDLFDQQAGIIFVLQLPTPL
jgi:carbohydrate-selective porin OprB